MPNFSFLACLELEVLWLEDNKQITNKKSVELEASVAPAEAKVWAAAKADQKSHRVLMILKYQTIKCCDMMVTKPR